MLESLKHLRSVHTSIYINKLFYHYFLRLCMNVSIFVTQNKHTLMKKTILILIAAGSAMFASAQIQFGKSRL